MKPLYIKKNGQVEKVTGAFAMPASYPAERVAYDNTNSGLSADDAQGAIDEIVEEVNDKVDKETGKGLSANDYTTTEKNKLEGISANANKVESSTTNGNIKIDSVETPVYRNYGNNAVLTTDKTPFLTRQTLNPTGFSGYVREKLVGASYAWNQILPNGNFSDTSVWNASKATMSISNNIATLVPNGQSASSIEIYEKPAEKSTKVVGHKYLASFEIKPSQTVNVNLAGFTGGQTRIVSSATANTWTKGQVIINCTTDTIADFYIYSVNESFSTSDSVQVRNIQLTDLTLAFGSTIADYLYSLTNNGGITKLRDMGFPIDKYTPYGYGLYSVKTSGKKIIGKNKFNIADVLLNVNLSVSGNTISKAATAYNLDIFSGNAGQAQASAKKLFLVAGTYTISYTSSVTTSLYIDLIDDTDLKPTGEVAIGGGSGTSFTLPRSGYICIKIVTNSAVNISNLQIELGSTSTTYEPYSTTIYSLGNDELRGKFDLVNGEIVASGDVKESNGGITRKYGIVNLGSLTWTYSVDNVIFYTKVVDAKNSPNNCICAKYTDHGRITAFSQLSDKEVSVSSGLSTDPLIVIKDTAYNDATIFKTAMDGVYLVYELATPTTEQSTPFADPMSLVGATTEEYIDTRDIPCPVGAERQYMGQSEDVVEIPSSPLSDGKRKLVAETSGGKTQYYFEDDKNGAGTQVNLMTYNTSTNKYVCPSDGYISLSNAGASVGDYVIMSVYGANDNLICGLRCDTSVASIVTVQNLFVKRGMKCYVRATSSTGSFTALFTPLA